MTTRMAQEIAETPAVVERSLREGAAEVAAVDGPSAVGPSRLRLPLSVPVGLQPAALILPGQLLAEAVSRARGHDPDHPTGLSKVTLTT